MGRKKKIVGRQGLVTSPKELRKIADELEKEWTDFIDIDVDGVAFMVNIINRERASDTWVFEDG